jgi:hypothetical protein
MEQTEVMAIQTNEPDTFLENYIVLSERVGRRVISAEEKKCSHSSNLDAAVLFASTSQGLRQDSAPNMFYGHRHSSITSNSLKSSSGQPFGSVVKREKSQVRYVSALSLEELRHCMKKPCGMRVNHIKTT